MARKASSLVDQWKFGWGVWGSTGAAANTPSTGKKPTPIAPELDPDALDRLPFGHVGISCTKPRLAFSMLLNEAGVVPTGGGPKITVSDRVYATGVPEYEGHDPITMTVSVLLDGYATSTPVDDAISKLIVLSAWMDDVQRMPTVRLSGPVPFPEKRWKINGPLTWDQDPVPIRNGIGQLVRQAITFPVIERVADTLLTSSIAKSQNQSKGGKGKATTGSYRVKQGQNDFGDVSKALYGNRDRALDLARLNSKPYGVKLKKGQTIRVFT